MYAQKDVDWKVNAKDDNIVLWGIENQFVDSNVL